MRSRAALVVALLTAVFAIAGPAVALPNWLLGRDWERIPTTRHVVALTFDAGSNPAGLHSILTTLAARHVNNATFFLTGEFAQAYPVRARTIAQSYRVANHSMTHPHFTRIGNARIHSQLSRAAEAIENITGADPAPLFRFPYGDRDERTIDAVNAAGYVPVRWTVDTLGWKGTDEGITPGSIIRRVLANLGPGEIVLMHVGANPYDQSTLDADALPRMISTLRQRGYSFVTLDALLTASPPSQSLTADQALQTCPAAPYGIRNYGPGKGKTVALTFDDGPGSSTPQILRALEDAHAEATFFNLGELEAAMPRQVRAEHTAGFALGDHTWGHRDLTLLDAAGQAREIDRERAEQASLTGAYPCLLRPPYGNADATTLELAQQRGMRVWKWSVDTEDWKAAGSADAYWVRRIITRAEAGVVLRNPVIVLHDEVGGNPATVAALPAIIEYYRSHGYSFVDLYGHTGLPLVNRVSPGSGRLRGGTRVTLTGYGFLGVRSVRFGTSPGRGFDVESNRRLTVVSPAHGPGRVHIRVTTTFGTSPARVADLFRYVRNAGQRSR